MNHPSPSARLLSVLVLDYRHELETLSLLLRRLGHEAQGVPNEDGAIEAARDRPPDVALLNIGLPGVDGYEVARHLRASPTRKPLLVALVGHGQEQEGQRAQSQGFDRYLVKPIDLDDVLKLLRGVTGRLGLQDGREQ